MSQSVFFYSIKLLPETQQIPSTFKKTSLSITQNIKKYYLHSKQKLYTKKLIKITTVAWCCILKVRFYIYS